MDWQFLATYPVIPACLVGLLRASRLKSFKTSHPVGATVNDISGELVDKGRVAACVGHRDKVGKTGALRKTLAHHPVPRKHEPECEDLQQCSR